MLKVNDSMNPPLRFVEEDRTIGQFYNSIDKKYPLAESVPYATFPTRYLCGKTGNFSSSRRDNPLGKCEHCFTLLGENGMTTMDKQTAEYLEHQYRATKAKVKELEQQLLIKTQEKYELISALLCFNAPPEYLHVGFVEEDYSDGNNPYIGFNTPPEYLHVGFVEEDYSDGNNPYRIVWCNTSPPFSSGTKLYILKKDK